MEKRDFIKTTFGMVGAAMYPSMASILSISDDRSSNEIAKDEDFWKEVRKGYKIKPHYLNLENGYYCITPREVLDRYIEHVRYINYEGSYYMRNLRWLDKDKVADRLAVYLGCHSGEVILTRNTTESLDTIIGGFPWQKGDEAVFAHQDYGAMQNMFGQVAEKYGVVNQIIDVPMHPVSDEEVVQAYESAITPRTKLLMVCHIVNITGHILPIRKICDMAHSHGVEVMVDGAHAIGHFDFNLKDLNCDYYGSSLHKWLSAPLGCGMLYVKADKIDKIWPRFAHYKGVDGTLKRLNHIGTHPCHTNLAIHNALDYLNDIGIQRKEARLRYLKSKWVDQIRDLDNVVINTPREAYRSCAIANVGIRNLHPRELSEALMNDYKIWTVGINSAGVVGCRITPNIYNLATEMDYFAECISELAS